MQRAVSRRTADYGIGRGRADNRRWRRYHSTEIKSKTERYSLVGNRCAKSSDLFGLSSILSVNTNVLQILTSKSSHYGFHGAYFRKVIGTPAPVGWGTWLSRTLPADAEAGGGLMVATIQFAITLGATLGGALFDGSGYQATFGFSATLLIMASALAMVASRTVRFHPRQGVTR